MTPIVAHYWLSFYISPQRSAGDNGQISYACEVAKDLSMKIVLLGKGGQVGWELQRTLAVLGNLHALGREDGLNLADTESLGRCLDAIKPDVVVNAAAYTAVDKAESPDQHALAKAINADAPEYMAHWAAQNDALFVHYSSDYVLDGRGDAPRTEQALVAPLSYYGATKAMGEAAIMQSGCRALILRTSWVYGVRGGNFARTMLVLATARTELKVVSDQMGAPTGADFLADVTGHMILQTQKDADLSGLYHVTAGGCISWHGYAQHLIQGATDRGMTLQLRPENIHAIPTQAYPTAAKRPLNSRLCLDAWQDAFGLVAPAWEVGVNRWLDQVVGADLS
jgi:dTDP-4-dehydrorhamnose reductase